MSSTTITTPPAMLSYPNLFEPKAILGSAPKFSATFIFDTTQQKTAEFAAMKAAVHAAVIARLGPAKADDKAFMRSLRSPFRDAGEKDQAGYQEGYIFVNATADPTKNRPTIVDLGGNTITDPAAVFAGQIVRASLNAFFYDKLGNKGVSFGLNFVQVLKPDMPRIDGRVSIDKAFGKLPPGYEAPDSDGDVI